MSETTPARPKPPTPQSALEARRVNEYLAARGKFIQSVIADPKLDAEKVIASATAYIGSKPELWGCDLESVKDAVIMAAKRNLLVGPEGYAYLVPFNDKKAGTLTCQYMLGYRGALELMRRSGAYASIEAFVVYEQEVKQGRLQVRRGSDSRFSYEPILFGKRGPAVGFMVFAKLTSGEFDFEAMDREEVDAIKGRSKASGNGPWVTDYERMALKTVINRFSKRAEMSAEDRRDLSEDEERFAEARDITPQREPLHALPSVEVSGAVRYEAPQTQAERVKADLRRGEEPASETTQPGGEAPAVAQEGNAFDTLTAMVLAVTTKAELDAARNTLQARRAELSEDQAAAIVRAIGQADRKVHRG